jgi:hypothetical protein
VTEGPIVESPMAGRAIRQTLTGAAALVLSCGGSTMRLSRILVRDFG